MADYKVPSFLKRDGDALLFNEDGQFVFYVPEIYFDRGDALIKGEYANLLGILDYTIYKKNGSNIGLKRFYFPTVFLCKPSRIDKVKNLRLKHATEAQDYRLLVFEKGDAVVVSVKVPQNIANVEDFFRIFLTGKLPTTIPYDKMQDYFVETMKLNGSSFNMNMQMFGVIVSEMCRSKADPSKAFRMTKMEDMMDYRAIAIADLPKYISPNSSISSQNWDLGVIGAITNSNDEVNSPMEKLLMGNRD
jgi:hypothetical protein